ncbi:beta-propeller domain-containing protein [Candidatus Woesearchaeota archaeon]|nr:beta-propeller domain-containing protein [Candidatus Woesearchaeota archaeon]
MINKTGKVIHMKKGMKKEGIITTIILLMFLVAAGMLLSACEGGVIPPIIEHVDGSAATHSQASFDPVEKIETSNFESDSEYLAFVKSNSVSGGGYFGGADMARGVMVESLALDSAGSAPMAAPTAVKVTAGESAQNGADIDYSETNNQVSTVDEADIIKTDGDYVYTISGNSLFIIKAYPGEDAEVISQVKFKSRPTGLFVKGDKLAVIGNFYDNDFFKEMDFRPRQGMTFVRIYDTSDKAEPKLVKDYKFEGYYSEARMTEGYAYLITNLNPEYRRIYPTPVMMDGATIKAMPVRDIHYFNIPYNGVTLANIHAINLADLEASVNSKSIAVENGQNLYMSDKNIYITYTEYINEWEIEQDIILEMMTPRLTDSDKDLIKKIKAADEDLLSKAEKRSKVMQIAYDYMNFMTQEEQEDLRDEAEALLKKKLDEYEHFEYTIVNRISVNNGDIEVEANGKVPGHIMNQFSMDEEGDVFRIATTISQRWSRFAATSDEKMTESTNNVFTMDKSLKVLGSLKGLAEGEQIYSTRFIGERLYMVTFRQVDPFFVIDLSDAKNPRMLGKLKIPGFSRYLHPYDANTIIGIGRDASETGRTRGLKISLFDVTDVEKPKEIAKFTTDERYAQSTAEYEHKAFLFSKEKELLVIPAYSQTYDDWGWEGDEIMPRKPEAVQGYNGAMVFKITKDDIELRGIVDHSASLGGKYYYRPAVERSLYIEDLLYTKSQGLLRINKIGDLSKVKNVELVGEGTGNIPLY